MVCKRKLDFRPGIIGFPVIPRGPRSVRRKISNKDDIGDKEISAFELLAAVAGKILEEGESSASSNSKTISRKLIPNKSDTVLETGSIISAFNISNNDDEKGMLEYPDKKLCVKQEDSSPNYGESSNGYVDNSIERDNERKLDHFVDFIGTNISKDKLKINVNYYPLINPDSTVQLTSFRDPNDSFLRCKNNVNISSRDDDENFIRCNQRKPKIRALRPRSCIGYRRIRKLSTSKYWNVAPKLMDSEVSNSERGMKRIFYNRKYCHNSQRFQREGPFKKRKLFDGSPRNPSDREGSSESISNTPEKGINGQKTGVFKSKRRMSSPFVGQRPSYQSLDSRVKFSIKSFKVPELYIEVPETATVGLLKRTVMEAVTAILEEGLRVGVLLQGEKVKDDERTLLQSGISQNGNLDKLGFSLEPISTAAPSPVSPEIPITLPPRETPQQLTRFVASPLLESGITSTSADPLQVAIIDTTIISNHELVPFTTDTVTKNEILDSVVLVPLPTPSVVEEVPAVLVPLPTPSVVEELPVVLVPLPTPSVAEELSVVPMAQKAKRTDLAQRRTRRPFSVTEVEALVEAVETLGTGRWRDVKLRAFEAADHRTYVDLKDKWKTLVHTASISPQQRRGQPVPQELLDRVLGAHAYWSQHQSKQQHDKNQAELGTLKATTPNVSPVQSCGMNKQ